MQTASVDKASALLELPTAQLGSFTLGEIILAMLHYQNQQHQLIRLMHCWIYQIVQLDSTTLSVTMLVRAMHAVEAA